MQFDLNAALWKGLLGGIPMILKICWPVVVFFVVVEGFRLARVNDVELWDRERLVPALLQAGKANAPQPRTRSSAEGNAVPSSLPTAGEVCVECGKTLSPKVAQYCRDNSARFAGKLLCFDHQRRQSSRRAMNDCPVSVPVEAG